MVSFGALSTRRSTVELVRTNLDPPSELTDLIARARLVSKLDESRTRVTLLQAPAGYGKTTLMSQWFRALGAAREGVAWISMDGAEGGADALLEYVAAAFATALPRWHDLCAAAGIAPLVNELRKQGDCRLFMDDVHLLDSAALNTLCQLIDRSPAGIRFVLASRAIPEMPLARMRARGQLLELGAEELKFTAAEAQEFLAHATQSPLNDAQLRKLLERTDGWITGIRLASGMLKKRADADEMLASLIGSRCAVADFFAEEVLAALPLDLREFLLQNSVLERLSPSLCDAVTRRSDGRQMLSFIGRSGLFLMPLDEERNWYRYHPLFAEFLRRRRLDGHPEKDADLHLSASAWFARHELPVDAIEYALKGGDSRRAAELLELQCQELTYTGKLQVVCQLAARLPDEALH